jgi:ATP-dependent protease ClpP protease subunit
MPCQQCDDGKWRWGRHGACEYDTRSDCERANQGNDMRNWYSIQNSGDSAEILIYDVIGQDMWGEGVSAKAFAEDISKLKDIKNINVRINSPGGSVFDGTAIYNSLVNHPATINVSIDGMALSAASFIAMAGDHVTMAENAMMMIHDPWSMVVGTADEMRKEAEMMDKAKQNIIVTYQNKVELSDTALADMMAEETWMTGPEAKDFGFVDEVTAPMKMAASYDRRILNNYHHVPAELMNEDMTNTVSEPSLVNATNENYDSENVGELTGTEINLEELEDNSQKSGRSISYLKREIDIADLQ